MSTDMSTLKQIAASSLEDRVFLEVQRILTEKYPVLEQSSTEFDWGWSVSLEVPPDASDEEWTHPYYISISHDDDDDLELQAVCDLGSIGVYCTEQDQVLFLAGQLEQQMDQHLRHRQSKSRKERDDE